ncbi:MAG: carboxylesterase family protein [Flavobacteriales bacterium]|nr:carboxylesterase family protein [Flavobacteriales bacterium]
MKHILLLSTILFSAFLTTAQCDGERYRNYVFDSFNVLTNVEYGSNVKYDGNPQTLLMDVYMPAGDTYTERPVVVVAHGGFFVSGSKTGTDVVPICERLAKMGYVAVSIEYRLGFPITGALDAAMTEAAMRGLQDGKAAVRFLRKTVAEDSNLFGIDPSEIYFAGSSAGGYIALHLAYMDEESEIPAWVNVNNTGLEGGLEGNSGHPDYPSDVNAIVNIAGAIGDTAWIHPGDEPALLFHGTNDQTVPFGSDMQYAFGLLPVLEVDGSNSVDIKLTEVGIEHCFEIYEGMDHVPHVSNAAILDTTISIMSNFLSYQICGGELDCSYRNLTVGIDDIAANQEFEIYPNPAQQSFNIKNLPSINTVSLYNQIGQLADQHFNKSDIDIQNLPKGIYLVHVVTDQKSEVLRLVVE